MIGRPCGSGRFLDLPLRLSERLCRERVEIWSLSIAACRQFSALPQGTASPLVGPLRTPNLQLRRREGGCLDGSCTPPIGSQLSFVFSRASQDKGANEREEGGRW